MNDAFFRLGSDLMAVGPAGSSQWTALNPALAARLGFTEENVAVADLDPHNLTSRDGTRLAVDWTVHEADGLAYWVGRERRPNLARELHHRLKNNLQFVLSLLAFQASRLTDAARAQFETAESRIRAVARLHESVYASADFSEVEFGAYLQALIRDLSADDEAPIRVDVVDVVLPMEQAVPLAIIAHELVRNALQHSGASVIHVSLRYADEGKLCLSVVDDGAGMESASRGSGLELVDLLVGQLEGTQRAQPWAGLHVAVTFPLTGD
jgi:two-component sensor histidine kinase